MEKLENFVNRCYLESDDDFYVLVYKIIKKDGKYGLISHQIEIDPYYIDISESYFQPDETNYAYSYVPELASTCEAQEISEERYYELISKIEKLELAQRLVNNEIKEFITNELGRKV